MEIGIEICLVINCYLSYSTHARTAVVIVVAIIDNALIAALIVVILVNHHYYRYSPCLFIYTENALCYSSLNIDIFSLLLMLSLSLLL